MVSLEFLQASKQTITAETSISQPTRISGGTAFLLSTRDIHQ